MSGVGAAILAGGAGRRMGGVVKALIEIEGVPIIDRQLAVLRVLCDEVVIAGGDPVALGGRGVPVLPDLVPGAGPLSGIGAALTATAATHVLCVACDMPFLESAVLARLIAGVAHDVDVVVPMAGGRSQPLCAVYSTACLEWIQHRLQRGERRASDLVDDDRLRVLRIDEAELRRLSPRLAVFCNVNTTDDLPTGSK